MKYICCKCNKEFEEDLNLDFRHICKNCLIDEVKKINKENINNAYEELEKVEEQTEEAWNIDCILS